MASLLDGVPDRRSADRASRLIRGSVAMEIDDMFVDAACQDEILAIKVIDQMLAATLYFPRGINLERGGSARDL